MKCFFTVILVAAVYAATQTDLQAQQRPILSPRDSVTLALDTNVISVNYGRPSMRGRKIMGGLVPWNAVWRTGANEATHLRTNFDMTLGGVPVPRGRYTLWTIPSQDRWTVIINKQTGQWGTRYDDKLDLARFPARPGLLGSVVDTFAILLRPTGKTSGTLSLQWENTYVDIPFERNDKIRPLSPPDSSIASLDGKRILITYSRPFARGRTIWGTVVPVDSLWRTGANLATALTTEADLHVGGTTVPHGSYTLYSILKEKTLLLIVSKKPGGTEPRYDPKEDLVRIDMKGEPATPPIDPFRIWFEPSRGDSVTLHLGWSDRQFSIGVTSK